MTLVTQATRGSVEHRPVLVVTRHVRGRATLRVPLLDGSWRSFDVSEKTARFLRVLCDAYLKDHREKRTRRGVRSRAALMRMLNALPYARGMDDDGSVVSNASDARKEIREGLAGVPAHLLLEVDLVETVHLQGYRIGRSGLDVVEEPEED